MLNCRKIINATFAAALASSTFIGATMGAAVDAVAADKDFKFPIVLCRFKQAVLKDSSGSLKVVADKDWGPEYAFPVGNVRSVNGTLSGDFSGTYEIPHSQYRLRLEGDIAQALDVAANHQLRLRTVLEKKLEKADSSGKLWQEVGQSSNAVIARTQSDGTVWENVYPYTLNSTEMQRYFAGGKLKQELVVAGIRDGLLDRGSVFKVGPACGFLDARTAKSVASAEDRQKYRSIFDQIADAPTSPVVAAEPKKKVELKLPEAAPAEVAKAEPEVDNRDQQDQQNVAQAHAQAHAQDPAQAGASPQQEMSPDLQAQLAQQNQLADQAAAAYNFQQQQAQNGLAQAGVPMPNGMPGQILVDGRDPASMQMPQANTMGQMAQNLQNLQSPEQVQQHLNMLEQQRMALAQQQNLIDQQQAYLAQRQQDLAANAASQASADPQASAPADAQAIQTTQAAPMGQSF